LRIDKSEFQDWAFGNTLENTTRGRLAEYIVAKALNVVSDQRVEWDHVDVEFHGYSIEVKASAYLQSWYQKAPSKITFDIAPRSWWWDRQSNEVEKLPSPKRLADIYVFCVFNATERDRADPQDTSQWDFFVVSTSRMNNLLGGQKKASLTTISSIATRVSYDELKGAVEREIEEPTKHLGSSNAPRSYC
jgi:hypothetical protein